MGMFNFFCVRQDYRNSNPELPSHFGIHLTADEGDLSHAAQANPSGKNARPATCDRTRGLVFIQPLRSHKSLRSSSNRRSRRKRAILDATAPMKSGGREPYIEAGNTLVVSTFLLMSRES